VIGSVQSEYGFFMIDFLGFRRSDILTGTFLKKQFFLVVVVVGGG